jgi:dipeptidyl aminopeptidase/acylaminoacyl peptidase
LKRKLAILCFLLIAAAACAYFFWPSRTTQNGPSYYAYTQARTEKPTQLTKEYTFEPSSLPSIRSRKLDFTEYTGPLGQMKAIATPVRSDGKRRPALVYLGGDFRGLIDGFDIRDHENYDTSAVSFLERDIVVYLPTLRAQNGNPGNFECHFGEVDDIIAALEAVRQRPDIDPDQIYLFGYGPSATDVILASCLTDIPKQVIALSGCVQMNWFFETYAGYRGFEPFDPTSKFELRMRSPISFTREIKVPVLHIDAKHSPHSYYANYMWGLAQDYEVPYRATIIPDAMPTFILRPVKDMIAERIEQGLPMPTEFEIVEGYRDYYGIKPFEYEEP